MNVIMTNVQLATATVQLVDPPKSSDHLPSPVALLTNFLATESQSVIAAPNDLQFDTLLSTKDVLDRLGGNVTIIRYISGKQSW